MELDVIKLTISFQNEIHISTDAQSIMKWWFFVFVSPT